MIILYISSFENGFKIVVVCFQSGSIRGRVKIFPFVFVSILSFRIDNYFGHEPGIISVVLKLRTYGISLIFFPFEMLWHFFHFCPWWSAFLSLFPQPEERHFFDILGLQYGIFSDFPWPRFMTVPDFSWPKCTAFFPIFSLDIFSEYSLA